MYPDAGKEDSELFEAIDAERLAREQSDPGFFKKANWPLLLAMEVATERGVMPVAPQRSEDPKPPVKKAAEPPVPVPPKKAARPAPPNPAPGNTTGATTQNTEASLSLELKKATAARDQEGIKRVMRKMEDLVVSKAKA
jgi:hypothetical protein